VRAPVYRHLDARSTFLGLAFPMEWLAVLAAGWLGTALHAPNLGALFALAIYLGLRLLGHGFPEGHLAHTVQWHLRQFVSEGRLSAVARARRPRFPFGPYEWRERPAKARP
jgi:hypothetical protein